MSTTNQTFFIGGFCVGFDIRKSPLVVVTHSGTFGATHSEIQLRITTANTPKITTLLPESRKNLANPVSYCLAVSFMRFLALIGCAVLFSGCVNSPYKTPPSTAKAQQLVNSARGNVDRALSDNQAASDYNRRARTKSELIDNKASVIEKYWK